MLIEYATPVDEAVHKTLEELEEQVWEIKKRCRERGHTIIRKPIPDVCGEYPDWGTAICYVCKENLGYYCPESEDGLCEYENFHGYTSVCKHCGQGRERK